MWKGEWAGRCGEKRPALQAAKSTGSRSEIEAQVPQAALLLSARRCHNPVSTRKLTEPACDNDSLCLPSRSENQTEVSSGVSGLCFDVLQGVL